MKGSLVMQDFFIRIKLGQSKSKLATDLVDSFGLPVLESQNLPPADVCGVHETFFSLDFFSPSCPATLSGETG